MTRPQVLGLALAALMAAVVPARILAAPLQPFLDRLVKQEKLPGAVLLVSGPQGREVVAAGFADLKTRERMTPQTRFYIASSGKLVTAAATLQMVQEQRFKLADPVFPWVKSVPGIAKLRNIQTVTVEQLLQHRSGLAEYFTDDFESEAAEQPEKRWSAEESLAFAFGEKAQARPGREHIYTNTNYVLLGQLISQADRLSYAQAVQKRIFERVGMPSTTIATRQEASGLAHGYSVNEQGKRQNVSYSGWSAITGDGAVVTTAADYEAFLLALFRDGKLLPRKTVAQMCSAQEEDRGSGYGLGCTVQETPWGEAWGHNGSISGFNADTWYIPKLGVSVVFLTNGDFQSDEPDLVVRAVKAYLKQQ
ncbi:D-alanyl-D-alanine carboxypeptidase [Polaromonas sp. OV174]|uniref:serine hydrolase domain-containing protein n=1 Tax=Polaromonas sp. OV174 TaxID=1855300 RepID=UPI0008E426F0|nr:serine hydrolase domain-containing protein [Polaromonas sp. OV174]SFC12028.1 D-alanyl-D-alanine carboxypeptidase [Polaromonas sp. OV174]